MVSKKTRNIAVVFAIVILVFSAVSCGNDKSNSQAEKAVLALRAKMTKSESVSLKAAVRADYGERLYDFVLTFDGGPDDGSITILKPDLVSGVKAHISDGGSTLVWDDASLELGDLSGDLSPMSAVGLLITEWQQGYIESRSVYETKDGEFLTIRTTRAGDVAIESVFDAETLQPLSAEIWAEGSRVLTVVFADVIFS